MAGDYFSRDEVVAMLRAVVAANADLSTRVNTPQAAAYRAGFAAAIRALAMGFRINTDVEAGLHLMEPEPGEVEIDYWESPPLLPDSSDSINIIGDQ